MRTGRHGGAVSGPTVRMIRGMDDLSASIDTILRRCLGVHAGEEVLVIVDPGTRGIGDALRDGASALGAEAVLAVMDERATDGTEPTASIAAAMLAADVIIAPTSRSLSHTQARKRACDQGARVATLPGVTADMLARVMAVDFQLMAARSRALAELLDGGEQAHVSCPRGTDLTLNLRGRAGIADDGALTAPGAFGNLPCGEAFIAPAGGEGRIVAASVAPLGISDPPAILTVSDGRIVAAEQGLGPEFIARLRAHGELGCNLAELGVGTNDRATLTGNVLEDEKIFGTVHVAFGASASFGGTVWVPIHLDVVVLDASLTVDGTPGLMVGGGSRGRRCVSRPTLLAVPNFSEGRSAGTISEITRALGLTSPLARSSPSSAKLLDVHSDPDHNRTVLTLAGSPGELAHAVLGAAARAIQLIDLRRHEGVHPRVGALDVAPIVHLTPGDRGAACAEALVLADLLAHELGLAVFLYGELTEGRRTRAQIRRGGPLELQRRIELGELVPDFGPRQLHPSAGAVLVAARPPLLAFNVELAPAATLADARAIAAAIREGGSDGLPSVRAIGVWLSHRGVAQVSTNVEDHLAVSLRDVVTAIARHAEVARAELVGLAPSCALEGFPAGVRLDRGRTLEQALAER